MALGAAGEAEQQLSGHFTDTACAQGAVCSGIEIISNSPLQFVFTLLKQRLAVSRRCVWNTL